MQRHQTNLTNLLQLTCQILELVSNQNSIRFQRFVPLQVESVQIPTVDSEESWSVRDCIHTHTHTYTVLWVCNV